MAHGRLQSRIALITGASQNIGRGIAERFAAEGAAVALVDRQQDKLDAVTEGIRSRGGKAVSIAVDLTDGTAVTDMIETAVRELGGLDILVNNAYGGPYRRLTEQDDAGWQQGLAIGITAVMQACRAAIPRMIERGGGSIINLGSINSFKPAGSMAVYSAVKGAVVNFTRQIAVDYGPEGIRCNALCPGYIVNPERAAQFGDSPVLLQKVRATIPLRRVGTDEDMAGAALFLASDDSAFMTGHALVVDGGSTIQNGSAVAAALEAVWHPEGDSGCGK